MLSLILVLFSVSKPFFLAAIDPHLRPLWKSKQEKMKNKLFTKIQQIRQALAIIYSNVFEKILLKGFVRKRIFSKVKEWHNFNFKWPVNVLEGGQLLSTNLRDDEGATAEFVSTKLPEATLSLAPFPVSNNLQSVGFNLVSSPFSNTYSS